MQELTQKYIQSLFTYRDGFLYWKVNRTANKVKGNKAGKLENNGYYRIKIDYKLYLNHRLIFLYFNGYLPKYVDHIDGNPLNNCIENLREVTFQQNIMNKKSNENGSSQYKGVNWNKRANKWMVRIGINRKQKFLGYFKNEIDAAKVYNEAAKELFGEYACLNKMGDN